MKSWKAARLKDPYNKRNDAGVGTFANWERDGCGLTYEDYWLFVCIIGHQKYRQYRKAHWRDSDIMDKTDVWKALKEVSYEN